MNGIDIIFNIGGNAGKGVDDLKDGIRETKKSAEDAGNVFDNLGKKFLWLNQINDAFDRLKTGFDNVLQPGLRLDKQMRELQAITNVSDIQAKKFERTAKKLGETYGIDAAKGIDVFKVYLSKLGPELSKTPEALNKMTENAMILGKALEDKPTEAAVLLSSALQQYGVSLDKPIEATKKMTEMMNIMSAAAIQGSVELPGIQTMILKAGAQAKLSGLSFAEFNSAIQAIGPSFSSAEEGGTAFRRILEIIGQGEYMPEKQRKMLEESGVSINKLSDKTLAFTDRMRQLNSIVGDGTKMQLLFDSYTGGAVSLIKLANQQDEWAEQITGTNSALGDANKRMESYDEMLKRTQVGFDNIKSSMVGVIAPVMPILDLLTWAISALTSLGMMFIAVGAIAESKFGIKLAAITKTMWGFIKSVALAIWQMMKMAVQSILTGIQIVGSFVVGLLSATAAQLGLNAAMTANPIALIIVGIAAVIAAIAALIYWWDEIKAAIWKFAKWIIKNHPFRWLIELMDKILPGTKKVFQNVFDWIVGAIKKVFGWFKWLWDKIKGLFSFGAGGDVNVKMPDTSMTPGISTPEIDALIKETNASLNNTLNNNTNSKADVSGDGGKQTKSITFNFQNIIGEFKIQTGNNLQMSESKIRNLVSKVIVDAVRDAELAL